MGLARGAASAFPGGPCAWTLSRFWGPVWLHDMGRPPQSSDIRLPWGLCVHMGSLAAASCTTLEGWDSGEATTSPGLKTQCSWSSVTFPVYRALPGSHSPLSSHLPQSCSVSVCVLEKLPYPQIFFSFWKQK